MALLIEGSIRDNNNQLCHAETLQYHGTVERLTPTISLSQSTYVALYSAVLYANCQTTLQTSSCIFILLTPSTND